MNTCFKFRKQNNLSTSVEIGSLNEEDEKKEKFLSHYRTIRQLMPFLWPKGEWVVKLCVILALVFMVVAKLCTVAIPIAYGNSVDILTTDDTINTAVNMTNTNGTSSGTDYYYLVKISFNNNN